MTRKQNIFAAKNQQLYKKTIIWKEFNSYTQTYQQNVNNLEN